VVVLQECPQALVACRRTKLSVRLHAIRVSLELIDAVDLRDAGQDHRGGDTGFAIKRVVPTRNLKSLRSFRQPFTAEFGSPSGECVWWATDNQQDSFGRLDSTWKRQPAPSCLSDKSRNSVGVVRFNLRITVPVAKLGEESSSSNSNLFGRMAN